MLHPNKNLNFMKDSISISVPKDTGQSSKDTGQAPGRMGLAPPLGFQIYWSLINNADG